MMHGHSKILVGPLNTTFDLRHIIPAVGRRSRHCLVGLNECHALQLQSIQGFASCSPQCRCLPVTHAGKAGLIDKLWFAWLASSMTDDCSPFMGARRKTAGGHSNPSLPLVPVKNRITQCLIGRAISASKGRQPQLILPTEPRRNCEN